MIELIQLNDKVSLPLQSVKYPIVDIDTPFIVLKWHAVKTGDSNVLRDVADSADSNSKDVADSAVDGVTLAAGTLDIFEINLNLM